MGGWALTGKLAGDAAASAFFRAGLLVLLMMTAAQFAFFLLGRKRMIYRVVFHIAYGCGLVWFMLCLLLPVLWVETISPTAKFLLFLFLVAISIANGIRAGMQFKKKWESQGEGELQRNYDRKENAIDWPKVLAPMGFSMKLYIPGIPEAMSPFVSLAIVLGMLAGLSLRNVFPTFSLFAWGIPSCLVISMFAQLFGLAIAQIGKLMALEKRFGGPIKPNM